MKDDPSVVALVARAKDGDRAAWDDLVERYAPLVWSICRRHRMSYEDSRDVSQNVWLRLYEQLPALRTPAALPGWVATTTRRECLRTLTIGGRYELVDRSYFDVMAEGDTVPIDHDLLAYEREAALREAFAQLPPHCQNLLTMLMADPPVPYAEISAQLEMRVGSIGPSRARCLDRLRRCPALATLIGLEAAQGGRG